MADEATTTPAGSQYSSKISQGDLPWAIVLLPTTSSGQSGVGINKHGLQPESWVFGFFADGDDCQQPVIVGTLPGGPGKGSYAQQTSPGLLGGTSAGAAAQAINQQQTTQPIINSTTNTIENLTGSNIEKAMNAFIKYGYTAEQASGMIGVLQVESTLALDPKAFNPAGGGLGAYGIAQWRGDRQKSLKNFANQNANGEVDRIEVQLAYIVKELKEMTQYSGPAEKMLQNAKTPVDAAIAFAHYERGEDYSPRAYSELKCGCQFDTKYLNSSGKPVNVAILKQRIDNAMRVYQSFANNRGSGPRPGAESAAIIPNTTA